MRCYKCRETGKGSGRFTLKRHPLDYKRDPTCPTCGTIHVFSVEDERKREMAKREYCGTDCPYPFKHKINTMRMCPGHPLAHVDLTQEEMHDFNACVATPRSG